MAQRPSRTVTAAVMGTVASVHVHGAGARSPRVAEAVDDAIALLRADEDLFSTYRDDSQISLLRRGEAHLHELDPSLTEVWDQSRALRERSGGRFDAWWQGWFDPTGFVKGWSVERAASAALAPLVDLVPGEPGQAVEAVGISVGGDLRLFTADGSNWVWRVGISDPTDSSRIVATVELQSGAVATSGTAERPGHLVDPRSGNAITGALGATVVADTLTDADAWATIAAVAGIDDLGWIPAAPTGSGLITNGPSTRRWVDGVELSTYVTTLTH